MMHKTGSSDGARRACGGLGAGLLALGLLAAPGIGWAEDLPLGWDTSLEGSIGLAQTEFENYAEGGESSFTWKLLVAYKALRHLERSDWKTTMDVEFGQTKLGDQGFRKASDRLELNSITSWKPGGPLRPYISAEARTQAAPTYEYNGEDRQGEISRFANPLYLSEGVGVGTQVATGLTTRGGLGFDETMVTLGGAKGDQFALRFTDDPETADIEKTRFDAGTEWVTDFDREFPEEDLRLVSQFRVFSAFDHPGNMDVWFKFKGTTKVVKIIAITLTTDVIYDEDILKRTQFKESLTVGLNHTFF